FAGIISHPFTFLPRVLLASAMMRAFPASTPWFIPPAMEESMASTAKETPGPTPIDANFVITEESAIAGGLSFIRVFSLLKHVSLLILATCSTGGIVTSVVGSSGIAAASVVLPHALNGMSRY